MVKIGKDVTDPQAPVFAIADHVLQNADGSESYALDAQGTTYVGQEPNLYGVRNDSTGSPGAYQRFTRQGALTVSVTRPGDAMFVYSIAEGSAYTA